MGCFVFITLPGQVNQVVAGRLDVREDGVRFVYARSYQDRADAVAIDPYDLHSISADVAFKTQEGEEMFPSLRDAAPDFWGRTVMNLVAGRDLTEIEYLMAAPDDRAGALGSGVDAQPPVPLRDFNRISDLPGLLHLAEMISECQETGTVASAEDAERFRRVKTSIGGARPKIVIEDDDGLWLAKLSRSSDEYDIPRVEKTMLDLAENCGICVPQSKIVNVGGKSVFFVKRFDREKTENGYLRHRLISGVTILRASSSVMDRGRWSYPLLADEVGKHASFASESLLELFRRMTFNALITNTDDHPRNHAMINDGSGWRLSPAYDLTPTPMFATEGRSLAMTIGSHGRLATRDNLLSECHRFGLDQDSAAAVVDQIQECVAGTWYGTCRKNGVTEVDCGRIRSAFDYEGFEMKRDSGMIDLA